MALTMPSLPQFGGGRPPPKQLPLIVGGIVVAGLGGLLLVGQQRIQGLERQLAMSRQELQALQGQHDALAQQLSAVEAERNGLDERLRALRNQLGSATASLERSRIDLEQLQERYETLRAEHDRLARDAAATSAARDDAKQQVAELRDEKGELERSVGRLRERLALVERDYQQTQERLRIAEGQPRRDLAVVSIDGPHTPGNGMAGMPSLIPGTVELPPIVVRKDQAGLSLPVRGRLVEVNGAHQFVVLDKGSQDGVTVGMTLEIVRGAMPVGRIRAVRVRPNLAACDIISAGTPGQLQVGDQAVQAGR